MSNNNYNKFLTVLLVILGIAIVVLLAYFVYDIFAKDFSNKDAEEAVDEFQKQIISKINNINNNNGENIGNNYYNEDIENVLSGNNENIENSGSNNNSNNSNNNNNNNNNNSSNNNNSYKKSNVKYENYTMVGTIEIPKIKLKAPIVEDLTVKSLQKSTVLIYGNLNQQENAVIIGHNNRNGTFFSNLKKLTNGDKITITDYTGTVITYEVYNKFQAVPDDTSFYQRETNGLSEITLSTCTDRDDKHRIIVLARES